MSNLVVRMTFGSHLYGTSTTASDFDFKSVYVPTAEDIILQKVKASISTLRPKAEGEKNQAGETEEECYSLQRFLKLLCDGQTGPIDMVFAPDNMILQSSEIWDCIRENRARFLSKKSTAFVGYCRTQANKYGIKGSRVAAAREASEFFQRVMQIHGPLARVEDFVDDFDGGLRCEHAQIVQHPISGDGTLGWFFECCDRKVAFNSTIKQAAEVYTNIYKNYGARAQLAEKNEGIDWKALSHAVRVGYEAIELLETGNLIFPLQGAAHLVDIKMGSLPYQEVAEEIETLLDQVEESSCTSVLPDAPDTLFMDALVMAAYGEVIVRAISK